MAEERFKPKSWNKLITAAPQQGSAGKLTAAGKTKGVLSMCVCVKGAGKIWEWVIALHFRVQIVAVCKS